MSQAKPSDAEPQQKDPYNFPSQKFYNSNSSDVDHMQDAIATAVDTAINSYWNLQLSRPNFCMHVNP